MSEDAAIAAPTAKDSRWVSLVPSLTGSCLAIVVFLLAMTPSLLPRPPLFLGLVGGIAAAISYGIGVAAARILRALKLPQPGPALRRRLHVILAGLSLAG